MTGRVITQIVALNDPDILALDVNGLIWFGRLRMLKKEVRPCPHNNDIDDPLQDRVIEWQPIQGPPDGVHFTEAKLTFWENMEKKAREIVKDNTDGSGETIPLETEERSDTRRSGDQVQGASDDDLEDGEGKDSSQ